MKQSRSSRIDGCINDPTPERGCGKCKGEIQWPIRTAAAETPLWVAPSLPSVSAQRSGGTVAQLPRGAPPSFFSFRKFSIPLCFEPCCCFVCYYNPIECFPLFVKETLFCSDAFPWPSSTDYREARSRRMGCNWRISSTSVSLFEKRERERR